MPHLLELFSGTGSIGKVFREHGWRVTPVDIGAEFEPDFCCNVLDLTPAMIPGHVDLMWAPRNARTTASRARRQKRPGISMQRCSSSAQFGSGGAAPVPILYREPTQRPLKEKRC